MASILYDSPFKITLSWLFGIIGILTNCYVFIVTRGWSRQVGTTLFTRSNSTNNLSSRPRIFIKQKNATGRRTFITLITNLAIADLLASIYLLILASADLHYRFIRFQADNNDSNSVNSSNAIFQWVNDPFCYIARFLNTLSSFQSVFTIAIIASDRFISVTFPFSSKLTITPKRALAACILGWVIAGLVAVTFTTLASLTLPPLTAIGYQHHNICSFDNLSVFYVRIALLIYIISGITTYLVILSLYIGTYYNLRQTVKKIQSTKVTNNNVDHRTLMIAFSIMITNLLTWFPSFVCAIITFANPTLLNNQTNFLNAGSTLLLLFQVNSSINPVIYIFSTSEWLITIRSKTTSCFQKVDNNLTN